MAKKPRAVLIANGVLANPNRARQIIQDGDLLIAVDGGGLLCIELGIHPDVLIGDFDSLETEDLEALESKGAKVIRHPKRKDFTDLELAVRYAQEHGCREVLVLAALGARWDQTLANLLLPASEQYRGITIRLLDGLQEVTLARGGETLSISGEAGDTVSLIPLKGDAHGVRTEDLEYPLKGETLFFGATRGLSNVLLRSQASLTLDAGLLVCVVIHREN